jgi:hypothetical protein
LTRRSREMPYPHYNLWDEDCAAVTSTTSEQGKYTYDAIKRALMKMQAKCELLKQPCEYDCLVMLKRTWDVLVKQVGVMAVDTYALSRFCSFPVHVVERAEDVRAKCDELRIRGKRPQVVDF